MGLDTPECLFTVTDDHMVKISRSLINSAPHFPLPTYSGDDIGVKPSQCWPARSALALHWGRGMLRGGGEGGGGGHPESQRHIWWYVWVVEPDCGGGSWDCAYINKISTSQGGKCSPLAPVERGQRSEEILLRILWYRHHNLHIRHHHGKKLGFLAACLLQSSWGNKMDDIISVIGVV